jgi:hypothetical protein
MNEIVLNEILMYMDLVCWFILQFNFDPIKILKKNVYILYQNLFKFPIVLDAIIQNLGY